MNLKKRAVIYVRVSTEEQGNGHSPDSQEQKLREYCRIHKIEIVEVYTDEHSAKKGFDRPAYNQFLSDLKSKSLGKIDYFLVTQYSRFSRNLEDAMSQTRFLRSKGITLIAIEQPLKSEVPEDKIVELLYHLLPQIEIERLSLRTKDGIHAARQKGCYITKPPLGYLRIWHGTESNLAGLTKDPLRWLIVEEIFELFNSQMLNGQEIRKKINEKYSLNLSRNEIYYIAKNKVYCGLVPISNNGNIDFKLSPYIEPIVSEELFNSVQQIFKVGDSRSLKKKEYKEGFIFHRIAFCSSCGHQLTPSNSKGNGGVYSFYECKYRKCVLKMRIRKEEVLKKTTEHLTEIKIPNEVIAAFTMYSKKQIESSERFKKTNVDRIDFDIKKIENQFGDFVVEYSTDNKHKLDPESFAAGKKTLSERKQALIDEKSKFVDLDATIVKKSQQAGYVLQNLDKIEPDKNPLEYRELVRAIMGGGVVCTKTDVRTKNPNPFIDLMRVIAKESAVKKERSKPTVSTFSLYAPSPGLEPGTP